jgi:hypothetical protein
MSREGRKEGEDVVGMRAVLANIFVEKSLNRKRKLSSGAASSGHVSKDAAPPRVKDLSASETIDRLLPWSFPPSQNVSAFFIRREFSHGSRK